MYNLNIVYFNHFSYSKIVEQCFVELLSRMTKIRFLPALIYMTLILKRIFRIKVLTCIDQFVVKEVYSYICLRVFPVF